MHCIDERGPLDYYFPYYNDGSLGDMLLKVSFKHNKFTRAKFHLEQEQRRPPPIDQSLRQVQLTRFKEVVLNMPHIMHALVDGMAAA